MNILPLLAASVGSRSHVRRGSESASDLVTGAKRPPASRPGGRSGFPARTKAAFTLVEVAMALGIIAFAFVSIFGLVPVGMTTFRRTMDISVGSQIAQRVIGDAIETDFDTLTADSGYTRDSSNNVVPANYTFRTKNPNPNLSGSSDPMWRYFDDQGNELSGTAGALYHVLTRINPEVVLPSSGSTGVNTLAQVTVQVVNNPGNRTIAIADSADAANQAKPLRNLVVSAPGLSVYTCTALIAKNK